MPPAPTRSQGSTTCWLLDGNILVAIAVASHPHHARAIRWFDSVTEPFATCATTEGTLLRLHMQSATNPDATAAWEALRRFHLQPSFVFWDDGFSYLDIEPAALTGHRQVTDAWLAHLARRRRGRIATLDATFAQGYPDVVTLIPASI